MKNFLVILAFITLSAGCKKERCKGDCYIVSHLVEKDTIRQQDITDGKTICDLWDEFKSNPNSNTGCTSNGCIELICP